MKAFRALIIHSDSSERTRMENIFQKNAKEAVLCPNGLSGIELLQDQLFTWVICEYELEEVSALELLNIAKKINPNIVFIFTSKECSVESITEAMRLGAFDFIQSPVDEMKLSTLLSKSLSTGPQVKTHCNIERSPPLASKEKLDQIIFESAPMKKIHEDIARIAKSSASVFISGESGTGKEVIAHAIHYQSERKDKPFIKVNCAAVPDTLIESEFFGHEKGAFTGAIDRRMGRFELANKGTLLLDEISEIPLALQAKLLRAVQEQEFERVGGTDPIKVDVRIISTSNRNMLKAIEQNQFREDLYYRLNVVPIHIPPLRERKEDILPLAEYFLTRFCQENKYEKKSFSEEARRCLLEYNWPGNIRELANLVERAVVMNISSVIQPEHFRLESLPASTEKSSLSLPVGITLAELEKKLILETLLAVSNNRTKAAEVLGISIRTLRNKLHLYNQESADKA